jgi:hypothetical protein
MQGFLIQKPCITGMERLPCILMTERSVSSTVARRMKRRPGRLFTYEDFGDLPASAVAPALSRLRARGDIRRARKGVYYFPRRTVLGEVPADPVAVGEAVSRGHSAFAGLSAASALGLTTQVPSRIEIAVEGKRPIAPHGVEFRPRVGTKRRGLLPREAALFEVLRDIKNVSDLSPRETADRLRHLLTEHPARTRVLRSAISEPPRVRAMVGALSEAADATEDELLNVRKSLNPMTRYDFGPLSILPTARSWGAR